MKMRRTCLYISLFTLGTCQAGDSITLTGPRGGWVNGAITQDREEEIVAAYPKPPVNRGGQKYRTLIEGELKRVGQSRKPGRFIVNGIDMPLYTDEQGHFVKPWAFGPGSNNVEIVAPDGEHKRLQFYDNHTDKTRAKLRIVLGWDDGKAEVDMHVLTPDGEHAFFANPLLRTGGGLDVDSVDGGGPEIFSTATPLPGSYLIYVNYWGNFDAAGYNFDPSAHERHIITARFTIVQNENTADERMETIIVPLRRVGDLTFVRALRLGDKK
jgi:uncharacterized protein YfaP (DUF2135 family)